MTNTQDWADKVERAATDPERIERRKRVEPALKVPRQRDTKDYFDMDFGEPNPVAVPEGWADHFGDRSITYLSAEALAKMEASEQKVPESHAIRAKELRARFLR